MQMQTWRKEAKRGAWPGTILTQPVRELFYK
jgi:hypothetical protein